MDAPKGRYSVLEKDGRLIVIDNGTGSPVSPSVPPPPRSGQPSAPRMAGPVGAGEPGNIDRLGRLLLALVVREWDSQGLARVAWEWEQNGRKKRWDASLDERQQRRLGRALVALASLPLMVLLAILSGGLMLGPMLLLVAPAVVWGVIAILRLQRETGGTAP